MIIDMGNYDDLIEAAVQTQQVITDMRAAGSGESVVLYEAYEKLTVALLSLGAIEPAPDAPEWGMEQC